MKQRMSIFLIRHIIAMSQICISWLISLTLLLPHLPLSTCNQAPLHRLPTPTSFPINQCLQPTPNTALQLSTGNCNNLLYYIQIGIGSPPQNFYLQWDTGSYTLWVPTTMVKSNGFNVQASYTCNLTNSSQTIQYASQSYVTGIVGSDVVTVLPLIGVVTEVLFVTNQVNMQLGGPVLGIVGMGYSSMPNFLDYAYQVGNIQSNTFALQLKQTTNSSIIYYNLLPPQIIQATLSSPITGSQGYFLSLIGVLANSTDLTSYAQTSAVIDSGTSLFYLNPSLYQQFVSLYLQGCTNSGNGYFVCSCAMDLPTLWFLFPGVAVAIPRGAYVTSIGSGNCQVFINTLSTTSNFVLLGDTVFINNIVTFNKNQATVGFCGGDIGPNAQPNPGPSPVPVPIIGSNKGFIASQFVMLSFTILFIIFSLILFCLLRTELKVQPGTQFQAPLSTNTDQIYRNNAQVQMKLVEGKENYSYGYVQGYGNQNY